MFSSLPHVCALSEFPESSYQLCFYALPNVNFEIVTSVMLVKFVVTLSRVNETTENVMKTPDFSSNQCMKLVASALKKPVGEAVIISSKFLISQNRPCLVLVREKKSL